MQLVSQPASSHIGNFPPSRYTVRKVLRKSSVRSLSMIENIGCRVRNVSQVEKTV